MENHEQTIRDVVGENVRRIREAAGARQDDVATAARGVGLTWTRSKITALERGEKALDLAEAVLLAQVMGRIAGEPVSIADDLLAGDGAVRLSRDIVLYRESLRRFLGGDPVKMLNKDTPGGAARAREAMARMPALLKRMSMLAGDDCPITSMIHAETVAGETELRAGHTLGLTKIEVAYLSVGLWGRTLTEERDRIVGEDLPPASRAAKRGRVTRQLVDELRVRLAEVSDVERQ
jgi:transcriptional regulator with XRE-family HTH domain